MFFAILLLFGLLYLNKYCENLQDTSIVPPLDTKALFLTRVLTYITFAQILMGTQVRQQVDHLMRDTKEAVPETVIEQLGSMFYIHRTFSLVLIGFFLYLLSHLVKDRYNRSAVFLTMLAFLSAMGNVITGITLGYFDFPANAQPPHLFFGVTTIGLLYSSSLNLRGSLLED